MWENKVLGRYYEIEIIFGNYDRCIAVRCFPYDSDGTDKAERI
jgi:hypothetical protein